MLYPFELRAHNEADSFYNGAATGLVQLRGVSGRGLESDGCGATFGYDFDRDEIFESAIAQFA